MASGCATQMMASKVDMSNFRKDNFECDRMTREVWVAPLIAAPFVAAAAQKKAQQGYRECMEIRGYVITERADVMLGINFDPADLRVLSTVPGTPAEAAGFKTGDTVKMLDGRQVRNLYDFSAVMRGKSVGDMVVVTIERDGTSMDVTSALA
jgi:S1-C subfamily serine protease